MTDINVMTLGERRYVVVEVSEGPGNPEPDGDGIRGDPGSVVINVEFGGGVNSAGDVTEVLLMALEAVTGVEVGDDVALRFLAGAERESGDHG